MVLVRFQLQQVEDKSHEFLRKKDPLWLLEYLWFENILHIILKVWNEDKINISMIFQISIEKKLRQNSL